MPKKVARLFEQFQPEKYDLQLNLDRDNMTFRGTVMIRGKKTGRPSKRITLHQKELNVTSAAVVHHTKKGDETVRLARINRQNTLDEVRLHSGEMLFPGIYSLRLDFNGKITRPMNGIYPCFYTIGGKQKKIIATQFESHHAREAFPCIDEPEAKAVFELTIISPGDDETVLSNTPIKQQSISGQKQSTSFEPTPKMSVYLLAFAFGELGYTEDTTKDGVVVRAYATPDKVTQTKHALEVAVRSLQFFSEYFDRPYPLAKLDMLALPDFSSGAMENWGLVTYRETAMLADQAHSSIESQQMIALVVAHELSHQWFGNLVTMKWWDDLWLNESFANLMEYRAVDELFPDWHIWELFVSNEGGSAFRRDSLVDVQPIQTTVNHPDEISTLFDPSIVYAKGGTVLRMLMEYIGEADFRQGLKSYFEKHSYANTVAKDLWHALSDASQLDIAAFMEGWLSRPGFPIVSVGWQPGQTGVDVAQKRFLVDPSATAPDVTWQIPLAASAKLIPAKLTVQVDRVELKDAVTKNLMLNHNGQSYFLPHYTNTTHLQQITEGIGSGAISTIDRFLLLDNYTLLQRGGVASTVELLDLLPAFRAENEVVVWQAIAIAIGEIRRLVESNSTAEDQLDQLVIELVEPLVKQLGWSDNKDDTPQRLRLRGLLIGMAVGAKEPKSIKQGLKLFDSFNQPSDLSASTRTIVYHCGARHGSEKDFLKLLALHHTVSSADEKDEIAGGLTTAKKSSRYHKLIELLASDEIRRQDLLHWFVWLLRNRHSRSDTWNWLRQHWDWIEREFASDKSYSFFARYTGSIFSRPGELSQFKDFFGPKQNIVALSRDINLALQEISSRIIWRENNESAVIDRLTPKK